MSSTFPNRENPTATVQPHDQNAPGVIGETRPTGYTQCKMAKRSTKDQVA